MAAEPLELATAYVTLAASAKGIRKDVNKQLGAVENDFDKAGKRSGKRFSAGMVKAAGVAGGALAALGAGKFLKGAISEASDLNESVNAIGVTYGKNAAGIEKLGKKAANAMGLSTNEFNSIAVQFAGFTETIAGKGGDVVGTLEKLSGRGADFASVMNLDVNEAMRLFQSGLAGETEPLRRYGIDLSAAAVENYAMANGIAEAGEKMTEQQKVQARYGLLMEKTSKVQGDFQNTSDSLANSQRRLSANWKNIQARIGAGLLPVLEKMSNFVVDKALPTFDKFITQWKSGDGAAGGFKKTLSGVWDVAKTAFGYVEGTAVPIVKNLIDEFRTGEGTGGKLRDIFDQIFAAGKQVFGWLRDEGLPALQALAGFIKNTLWPDIKTAFIDRIWPAMKEVGRAIKAFWEKDAQPALKGLWKFIKNTLAPFLVAFYEEGVKPTFKGIGDVIEGAYKFSKAVLTKFKASVQGVEDKFIAVRNGIGRAWRALTNLIARPINAVIDKINAFLSAVKAGLNKIPGVDIQGNWTIRKIILDTSDATVGGGPDQALAGGGVIRGPWRGPKADNVLGLDARGVPTARVNPGEMVLSVAGTKKLIRRVGRAGLSLLNRGELPGFAVGGRIGDAGVLGSASNWLSGLWDNAKDWVKKYFAKFIPDFGGSWAGKVAKGAVGSLDLSGLADWVKERHGASYGGKVNYPGGYGQHPTGQHWSKTWAMIKSVVPDAIMTSNVRGAGSLTASGIPSLHGLARAVDWVTPGMKGMVEAFRRVSRLRPWSQHFFTQAGPNWQHGIVDEVIKRTHRDHAHTALSGGGMVADRGAVLAPGPNLLNNKTGGPEPLGRLDTKLDLSDEAIEKLVSVMTDELRELLFAVATKHASKTRQYARAQGNTKNGA